jgi:chromosome segregation ATPase
MHTVRSFWLPALLIAALSGGCKSAYYATWEKLGWEKRDILVDRVEDARDAQESAKEEFKTTLQKFQEVTGIQGGELQDKYEQLSKSYERADGRANDVREQIAAVESVANDLFAEWEAELGQYSDPNLRRSSQQKLDQTRDHYKELLAAMKRAEQRMDPVLKVFRDQVLYLKHNLNAQAIGSLQATATQIEGEVAGLITDMEASIDEANQFIEQMK